MTGCKRFSVYFQLAFIRFFRSIQDTYGFGTAGSEKTGKANDLSLMNNKIKGFDVTLLSKSDYLDNDSVITMLLF